MKKPISKNYKTGGYSVDTEVLNSLISGGFYIPEIDRVMFNLGKRTIKFHLETLPDGTQKKVIDETQPVLTTIIYWADGTKTAVLNSQNDPVRFDSDNKVSKASKEAGVVYAIVKRLCGKYAYDDNGRLNLKQEGFGRILNSLVDTAYDCQEEAAKAKAKAAAAKAEYEARKNTAKKPRPSIAQGAIDLSNQVAELKEVIKLLKADLAAANR